MQKKHKKLIKNVAIVLVSIVASFILFMSYRQNIKNINKENNETIKNEVKKYYELKLAQQILLEQRLQKVNVMILNYSIDAGGSGVYVKYKGRFYILSAAHLVDNDTDILFAKEPNDIIMLETVAIDYSNDLVLFRAKNTFIPKDYIDLTNFKEPEPGTELYIVGNPARYEDVIEEGRVLDYSAQFMYITGTVWFGNSGGGCYTRDGKLVGIASHIFAIRANEIFNAYQVGGFIRLSVIETFLKGINE